MCECAWVCLSWLCIRKRNFSDHPCTSKQTWIHVDNDGVLLNNGLMRCDNTLIQHCIKNDRKILLPKTDDTREKKNHRTTFSQWYHIHNRLFPTFATPTHTQYPNEKLGSGYFMFISLYSIVATIENIARLIFFFVKCRSEKERKVSEIVSRWGNFFGERFSLLILPSRERCETGKIKEKFIGMNSMCNESAFFPLCVYIKIIFFGLYMTFTFTLTKL